MQAMSATWLRAAAVLYSVGLLHSILTVLRRRPAAFRPALLSFAVGAVLHMVSLVEQTVWMRHFPLNNSYETASSCAFLIALVFLAMYARYRIETLGVFLWPLVAVLTLVGALGAPLGTWTSAGVRDALLTVHVALVLVGYAALLVMAASSAIYLIQERQLKSKDPGVLTDRLPPLATLDELITRSTAVAFALITVAVIVASIWASVESGAHWIREPKILISLATWVLYLMLAYLRVTLGWRGRKAAYMGILVVGFSALTWAAHSGLRSLFPR
jgi:ABC-type uncharacterized transport system permease subunit